MLPGIEPIQIGVITAAVLAAAYIWLLAGRGKLYSFLSERFLYGVPWGTVVCISGVVAFYLFAQSGLTHWSSPVTLPFRSWSYYYPEGLLAAGFAHAGPAHLTGNMIGTLVLAPIVEYAWSHYPPPEKRSDYEFAPPADVRETVEKTAGPSRLRDRPWFRALVSFPAAVFVVSIVTSVFAFGWSLGFSGTVFAFGGFAVIYFPVAAIIAMVGFTGTAILINTLLDPVLRATASPGAPGPPGWWGVNIQAHLLGFLIGVILALLLLQRRGKRQQPLLVFFAVLLFGLSRQLYVFTASGGEDVYLQLRGVGVIFVLALTVLVTATVAADQSPLPSSIGDIFWGSTMRLVTVCWIGAVAILGWAVWSGTVDAGNVPILGIGILPVLAILLLFPFLPEHGPRRIGSALSRRDLLLFAVGVTLLIVALPSIASNLPGMDDDPVPGENSITIEDYEVTYAEDVRHGRTGTNESGVIVVSEQRGIWSSVVDKDELSHDGQATVVVGGFGWRETVTANRSGWVATGGNETYVVDLEYEEESVRAFTSEAAEARARITGKTVAIEPVADQFRLTVSSADSRVGTVPIPAAGETATVGGLEFETEDKDGTLTVFAMANDTRVQVAQRESFD